jgi:hypothetical protein
MPGPGKRRRCVICEYSGRSARRGVTRNAESEDWAVGCGVDRSVKAWSLNSERKDELAKRVHGDATDVTAD